jgi:hypothetical protein
VVPEHPGASSADEGLLSPGWAAGGAGARVSRVRAEAWSGKVDGGDEERGASFWRGTEDDAEMELVASTGSRLYILKLSEPLLMTDGAQMCGTSVSVGSGQARGACGPVGPG